MKPVNNRPLKIDVVKFDSTNNFNMWRCEVMDALTTSNLKNSLRMEEKPKKTSEKYWDKMNRATCDIIRSYLTQDIKYHMMTETSAKKIWEIFESKY